MARLTEKGNVRSSHRMFEKKAILNRNGRKRGERKTRKQ